jgi:hypothetical protein
MNTWNSTTQSCELVPEAAPSVDPSESTTPPEPTVDPSEITDLPLGATINVSGTRGDNDAPFQMTVKVGAKKASRRAIEEYGEKPKGTYVGLQVQYTCTEGSCEYGSFDFALRNSDGEEFDSTYGFQPNLESGNLRKGRKAKGWITYDLAKGTYYLEYRAHSFDDNPANWIFKV